MGSGGHARPNCQGMGQDRGHDPDRVEARLANKLPAPRGDLTQKNKRFLRQFDDPVVLQRLRSLPAKLWSKVRRDNIANFRTLSLAQAALALEILISMPIRMQNLARLEFDVHLFLRDGPGAVSTLDIPAEDVKNKRPIEFDIPPHIARMLIEYRDHIVPRIDRPETRSPVCQPGRNPEAPANRVEVDRADRAPVRGRRPLAPPASPPGGEDPAGLLARRLRAGQATARPREPENHRQCLRRDRHPPGLPSPLPSAGKTVCGPTDVFLLFGSQAPAQAQEAQHEDWKD